MNILYRDKDIIVVDKPRSVTVSEDSLLKAVRDLGEKEVFPVHRLDALTTGAIVLALNKKSAAFLSKAITDGNFKKEYLAVVSGDCPECDNFEDELFFDRQKNKSFAVSKKRAGTKHASLSFKRLEVKNSLSLVRVTLHTGRTHQIRVQFASRKMALYGDGKYGSKINGNLALHSFFLSFPHPVTHKNIDIECLPKKAESPWDLFELTAQ